MKQMWPATERNKQPILDVLRRILPSTGRVLEIASGSGQHAVYFAQHLTGVVWLPSDLDVQNLASVEAHRAEASLPNVEAARLLDVRDPDWGVGEVHAVFNANMIHIAAFACTEGLLRGVGRHLAPRGVFALYGPFRVAGIHTAPSNAEFDASLRQRNPDWGVRDVEAVIELGDASGLSLTERVVMPANNQLLVFHRKP